MCLLRFPFRAVERPSASENVLWGKARLRLSVVGNGEDSVLPGQQRLSWGRWGPPGWASGRRFSSLDGPRVAGAAGGSPRLPAFGARAWPEAARGLPKRDGGRASRVNLGVVRLRRLEESLGIGVGLHRPFCGGIFPLRKGTVYLMKM